MKKKDHNEILSGLVTHIQESIFPDLPAHLYYHNPSHTLQDVLPASIKLAEMESISSDDLFLLKVAILFHDTGFTEQYPNNEEIGARIARETLNHFDFSATQISRIEKMILATRVKTQGSKFLQMAGDDILEKIICDADLDNLGRDDFFEKSRQLREEMLHFGRAMNDKDWNEYQFLILESHTYLTDAARKLRKDGQQKNLARLKQFQK